MANTFKFGDKKWATKEGSVLAYNDENGNFKPLPFDFTRASSATRVNENGLIEVVGSNEPRIDYLNNTSGHLLLEPSRTNQVTTSSFYPNTYWGTQGATITLSSNSSAPDGDSEVAKLAVDTTGTFKGLQKNEPSAWNSKTITLSTFVKHINSDYIFFYTINAVGGTNGVWFKISDGTIGTTQGAWSNVKMEDYGNGWYRCSANVTFNAAGTSYLYILNAEIDANQTTTVGNEMYLWGAQIEEGSYATSYIPTSGSSVTRAVDDADNTSTTVLSLSNSASFYWDIKGQTEGNSDNNSFYVIAFATDSSTTSSSYFGLGSNATNWRIRVQDGSTSNFKTLTDISKFDDVKVVIVLNASTYSIYANGTAIYTDESYNGTSPTIETIQILNDMSNENRGVIRVSELKAYNTKLTPTEAIALTS